MRLFSRLKLSLYLLLFIIGCEKNNTNNISLDNFEVISSNCYEAPFYYNLITNTEDETNWHVSLQKIEVPESMPSIILGSDVFVAIYNSIPFDDIITTPTDVEWFSDTSLTSYGNAYEVLHYKYLCLNSEHTHSKEHKVMVIPNNYLIKESYTNKVYKLRFEDYNNWVVLFNYSQLNVEK